MELRGFRVRGRVQGVGFRWWTHRTASGLGLGGYVRNLPDGSVEVQVAGEPRELEQLEESLWRGPSGARVEDVQRMRPNPDIPRGGFHIEG